MFGVLGYLHRFLAEPEPVFHLFPDLPAEIRLHIFRLAIENLPKRIVEASLRFEDQAWTCSYSPPKNPTKDRRCLSKLPLFAANVESREFCLEQYVKFGNTYIHPTLDLIYITWYWAENTSSQEDTKFYPIHGQPLTRFRRVALSLGRNPAFNGRFGALADCVRHLGSPEEVMLTLAGPNLPTVHTLAEGFSISNGNQVSLLDWPANPQTTTANSGSNNGESSMAMANALRLSVIEALEVAQTKRTAFKLPTIDKKLYYFNSGP